MATEQEAMANHVVESFLALLDSEVSNLVGEHNFNSLKIIVHEAMAEHSEIVLDRLEAVIRQLKSEIERRPLEL